MRFPAQGTANMTQFQLAFDFSVPADASRPGRKSGTFEEPANYPFLAAPRPTCSSGLQPQEEIWP